MKLLHAQVIRQLPYLVVGLALLLIAAMAVQQTLLLRQDLADQRAQQAAQTLQSRVNYWESTVLRQTQSWIDELEQTSDIAAAEMRMRGRTEWFDAVYVWETTPSRQVVYPPRALVDDPARRLRDPCIFQAEWINIRFQGNAAVEAYRKCRNASPPFNLYAVTKASHLLLKAGHPQDAWTVLNEVSVPLMMPLHEAVAQGMPLSSVLHRRIKGAQVQGQMGQSSRQQEMLLTTTRELTELDAQQLLEHYDPYLRYIIPTELRNANAPQAMAQFDSALERALRRVGAYKEIVQRLVARPVPEPGGPLQITLDPYDINGFVLLYTPVSEGRYIMAIQLDPERLLEALPSTTDLPEQLILDADGSTLSGEPIPASDIWVQVPFGKLFPHLRLALRTPENAMEHHNLWLFSQLAPVSLALILGGLALVARLRADRRREELYARQRDFITRVTHELKTPLAGIRIMAETLEMVVEEDPDQQTFISRILQEVDRLTERIDEVLRLTRQPTAPRRKLLSATHLADEVSEAWLPRFHEAGGELVVNTAAEEATVRADEALLKDALNNLLSNALKYRHSERPLRCVLRVSAERSHIVFEVSDNGIGVPAPMRAAIFERFTRVEGPNRGKAGGHGLGLAFVAETARAHGGSVRCQEGPDGGARFTLQIRAR